MFKKISAKVLYWITDRSSSIEGLRTIPSAEGQMMIGLEAIPDLVARRAAVDLMVANAK